MSTIQQIVELKFSFCISQFLLYNFLAFTIITNCDKLVIARRGSGYGIRRPYNFHSRPRFKYNLPSHGFPQKYNQNVAMYQEVNGFWNQGNLNNKWGSSNNGYGNHYGNIYYGNRYPIRPTHPNHFIGSSSNTNTDSAVEQFLNGGQIIDVHNVPDKTKVNSTNILIPNPVAMEPTNTEYELNTENPVTVIGPVVEMPPESMEDVTQVVIVPDMEKLEEEHEVSETYEEIKENENISNSDEKTNPTDDEIVANFQNEFNERDKNKESQGNTEETKENTNLHENTEVTDTSVSQETTEIEEPIVSENNNDYDSDSSDISSLFDVRSNLQIGQNETGANSGRTSSISTIERSDNIICGIPGITQEEGEVDKASLMPWLVTLGSVTNIVFSFLCGGTLISNDVVLSSAHCFQKETPTMAKIGDEYFPVAKLKVHEKYNVSQAYNNIALIKLSKPVHIGLLEACLPSKSSEAVTQIRKTDASVVEWKFYKQGELPMPDVTASKILSNSWCVKAYESINYENYFPRGFDSSLLCVKLQKPSVCQGDSGVQLFSVDAVTNMYTLMGTISNPESSCGGKDYPAIYTKISSHESWIQENQIFK